MKLVTFDDGTGPRVGVLDSGGAVVDVSGRPGVGDTMLEVVEAGESGLDAIRAALSSSPARPEQAVRLLAPITPRNNVMAVGRNYHEHAKEFSASGFDASEKKMIPDHPIIFTKAQSSIVGPGHTIDTSMDPSGTSDYEGELGVIIGTGGHRIAAADAFAHVFGYTVINDVTARALQAQHVQFFIGKSAATFCPMGPCIVTADEIDDIAAARLRTTVNGEPRQDACISDLIFDIATLIEAISAAVLLQPGDVIATGTPSGVGIGFDPPVYLTGGDVVEVSIDGVGTLRNPVV
ncbi:MAG: fumarylacetoacetate hydrolase family protein [Acidimicrobiaceae bacterium]|nr:fumarylacetoacetate hydrolase family protein [Acidimicrobiaceae bacterium]